MYLVNTPPQMKTEWTQNLKINKLPPHNVASVGQIHAFSKIKSTNQR